MGLLTRCQMIGIIFRTALVASLCLPGFSQDGANRNGGAHLEGPVPRLDKLHMADEEVSRRLKVGESIPALNGSVTVSELGIRIPPPPPTPRYAADHVQEIRTECPNSLAYLDRELKQLFKDQAADIARMRNQPELSKPDVDSPTFQKWMVQSKAKALNDAEARFVATTKRAKAEQEKRLEQEGVTLEAVWKLSLEGVVPKPLFFIQAMDTAQHVGYAMRIGDVQLFLDEYGPAFSRFSKAVDEYVREVANQLDTSESKMPLTTLVVARLCKIRILNTYSLMTKVNSEIWGVSAGAGAHEPTPSPATFDASFSGISWTHYGF